MPETNRIEYEQILTGDIEKEVVAFLNCRYGVVFITKKQRTDANF